MDLSSYQRLANLTDQRPGTDEHALSFPLLGLASEVGSLVNQFKKRLRDGEAHELFAIKAADKLGDILWYVANLSEKLGYSLQDIADRNLQRVNERWSTEAADRPALLLDDRFPSAEQLPRQVKVKFEEVGVSEGQRRVVISSGGERLGDPLSDMAWDDDDYRYHDAFHLTYAAVLGWSPITRSFFRRQRESDPRYREVEDSGRAKVIEEAIAALTFDYARDKHYLEGVQSIDSALLETVVRMASGFEVRIRTARNWEQAILRSFEIWRGLRRFRGGIVQLDLPERTIELVSRTTPAVADETARPQPQEAPRTSGSPRP